MREYSIILISDPEGDRYTVMVPALPGCTTQGETHEQCIERAREVITGYIKKLKSDGEPVPYEMVRPQLFTIDVDV